MPSISAYLDRLQLLQIISKNVSKFTLLLGVNDARFDLDIEDIVEVGFANGRYFNNLISTKRAAIECIEKNGSYDIIHDTFGFFSLLFLQKKYYSNTKFVTSSFALNNWRIKRVWERKDLLDITYLKARKGVIISSVIEKLLARYTDYLILQSPGMLEYALDVLPVKDAKLAWISNNVDVDYWKPDENTDLFKKNALQILNVGGTSKLKGIFVLLKVIKRLELLCISSSLTIVGDLFSPEKKLILAETNKLNITHLINFVGKVDRYRLLQIYQEHDIFLYQTINDGSPRVVLEALACGLPVIASYHPGIDVLDPNKEFISFTRFGDVEDITSKISTFFRNPKFMNSLSRKSRRKVQENFNSDIVARHYLEFYQGILNQNDHYTS